MTRDGWCVLSEWVRMWCDLFLLDLLQFDRRKIYYDDIEIAANALYFNQTIDYDENDADENDEWIEPDDKPDWLITLLCYDAILVYDDLHNPYPSSSLDFDAGY